MDPFCQKNDGLGSTNRSIKTGILINLDIIIK